MTIVDTSNVDDLLAITYIYGLWNYSHKMIAPKIRLRTFFYINMQLL